MIFVENTKREQLELYQIWFGSKFEKSDISMIIGLPCF